MKLFSGIRFQLVQSRFDLGGTAPGSALFCHSDASFRADIFLVHYALFGTDGFKLVKRLLVLPHQPLVIMVRPRGSQATTKVAHRYARAAGRLSRTRCVAGAALLCGSA